jgi:hypothetical protein
LFLGLLCKLILQRPHPSEENISRLIFGQNCGKCLSSDFKKYVSLETRDCNSWLASPG